MPDLSNELSSHDELDATAAEAPGAEGIAATRPERLSKVIDAVVPPVLDQFGSEVVRTTTYRDELSLYVPREHLLSLVSFLKTHPDLQFTMLKDVLAIDWNRRKERFQVNYNLYSIPKKMRVQVRVMLEQNDPSIDSLCELYRGADWYERETYDMHGIIFDNHPDLRRMYMPEDFVDPETGDPLYPLRKEFPVMGVPDSMPLPEREISREQGNGSTHGTAHK